MSRQEKRPAENTCRIVKGLDAVWAHFCPSKPCLPLSIDGNVKRNRQGSLSRLITRRSDQNHKIKYCLLFCDFAGSLVKSPKGCLPSCPESMALRVLFSLSKNLHGHAYRREGYHRLARANTPASVFFRRFLPFSPWRAPARLRLKNQKSLENPSLQVRGQL